MSKLSVPGLIKINLRGSSPLPSPKKESGIRLGPRGRLMAAATLSLALHGGLLAAIDFIQSFGKQPQLPSLPGKVELVKPESVKPAEVERILLLEKFKAEKKVFIQQLLQDLHQDKRIPISDFAIKSEVLDQNIDTLKSGSLDIEDEKAIRYRYKAVLKRAKKWVRKFKKMRKMTEELHHFSHYQMFRGYLKGSSDIINILFNGIYNCTSSTKFQTALEDDIVRSENFGVIVLDPPKDPSKGKSGHMLSWFRDRNSLWQIENTNGGPPRIVPFEKGLRTPKEIFIAAYLINNGVDLSQLPHKIRRFYKRGVGQGGFPVAGVSSNLPKPPNFIIPNPYFGEKNPKPIYRNTRGLYKDMGESARKASKTATEIIEDAKINATALSLFQESGMDPSHISLSLIEIPKGVNWCNIADEAIDSVDFMWTGKVYGQSSSLITPYLFSIRELRYLTAIRMAKILSDSGDRRFESCVPELEYKKFEGDVKRIFSEGEGFDDDENRNMSERLSRGLSNPEEARKELIKIIKKFGTSEPMSIGREALTLLAIISSPKDFDLFKGKLFEVEIPYGRLIPINNSSYALLNMNREAEDIAKIFLAALEYEKSSQYRGVLMTQLGKLGYGIEALKLMKKELSKGLNVEYFNPHNYKRWITYNISKLHPTMASNEDIQILRSMIGEEEDFSIKLNLIAILAEGGRVKEAVRYIKKLDFSKLDDYHDSSLILKGAVLSLGRINSPEIRNILLAILNAYPKLATLVGEVFLQQGIRSKRVIKELKRILNNALIETSRRQYAALLLIQMGAL